MHVKHENICLTIAFTILCHFDFTLHICLKNVSFSFVTAHHSTVKKPVKSQFQIYFFSTKCQLQLVED